MESDSQPQPQQNTQDQPPSSPPTHSQNSAYINPSTPETRTNPVAIASIVLAFVFPLVGIITGAVALNQIKKTGDKGKGLAIAGLVISIVQTVVGILLIALLVSASFVGVQQQAKDTERKSDINTLSSQIEAYYARNGRYPSLKEMNDDSFRSTAFRGLALDVFKDPEGASDRLAGTPTERQYSYEIKPEDCNKPMGECREFVLTAIIADSAYAKRSLSSDL